MPNLTVTLPVPGEDPYGEKLIAAILEIVADHNALLSPETPKALAAVGNAGTLSGRAAPADHIHPHTGLATLQDLENAVIGAGAIPASRAINTGDGLVGGGTLEADRTLTVVFGDGPGTVAAGDDSRIVGALQAEATMADAEDWLLSAALPGEPLHRLRIRVDGTIAIGDSPVAVANVTGTSTVTVTTATSHNLGTGDVVVIDGVQSFDGANGTWTVTVVDDTTFTLDGATGDGIYSTGGTVQRILGGTGAITEGTWNLAVVDDRDGLVIRGRDGVAKPLLMVRDYRGAPIFFIMPFGGAGLSSADPNDLLFTTDNIFTRRFAANPRGGLRLAGGDPAGGVEVLAIGNTTTGPTANPDGTHLGEDVFTTVPGVVLWARDGRLYLRTSSGHTDDLLAPSRRVTWGIHASGSASTFQTLLCPAPVLTQAVAGGADSTDGNYAYFQTTTTSGNSGGVVSANFTHTRLQTAPHLYAKIFTDNTSVASTRYVVGLVTADRSAGAGPASSGASTAAGIYFRYDAAIDSTAFWRAVTCDGTNATVTTTSVPIAAGSSYELRIEVSASLGTVCFWVGDVLAATHTTSIPAAATQLGYQATVTTLTSAAKQLRVSRVLVNQE